MSKLGELTPVDPSTGNEFNPADATGRRIAISVEDVRSYLKLAEDKGGLVSENSKLEVFKTLSAVAGVQTHPLALGNVNRVYDEVRKIIEQLLSIHMDTSSEQEKIKTIKQYLTEIFTHSYVITRDEAIRIGLKIVKAEPELEKLMMELYYDYEKEAKLNEPFFAEEILGTLQDTNISEKPAFIETEQSASHYEAEIVVSRSQNLPMPAQIQLPPMAIPNNPSVKIRFKQAKWVDLK